MTSSLYIFPGIYNDYTIGIAFATASSLEEAIETLAAENDKMNAERNPIESITDEDLYAENTHNPDKQIKGVKVLETKDNLEEEEMITCSEEPTTGPHGYEINDDRNNLENVTYTEEPSAAVWGSNIHDILNDHLRHNQPDHPKVGECNFPLYTWSRLNQSKLQESIDAYFETSIPVDTIKEIHIRLIRWKDACLSKVSVYDVNSNPRCLSSSGTGCMYGDFRSELYESHAVVVPIGPSGKPFAMINGGGS